MDGIRDRTRDGLSRRFRNYVLQRAPGLWALAARVPPLADLLNAGIVGVAVSSTRNRPHPYSTLADYPSWRGLTDRAYYARHLPAEAQPGALPDIDRVVDLFRRPDSGAVPCPKSTLLFPVFAQYLTDGFLRTVPDDRDRTTSNHEIDLSPLYGRNRAQTDVLRLKSEDGPLRGRMKTETVNGEAFSPLLTESDGKTYRPEFCDDKGMLILDQPVNFDPARDDGIARHVFAVGGDRVNSTPQVAMLNTLFLREHNRIAGALAERNPGFDDERVFETARAITIVIFIKIVIEEYINHISSTIFRLRADPRPVWQALWNRPNWMTVEFSLLYRWHSMIPDTIRWGERDIPAKATVGDNTLLTTAGLARALSFTAGQGACRLGLYNTADFLLPVEKASIEQGRRTRLAGYNAYREAFSLPKVTAFDQITGDARRIAALEALYGDPDAIEFYVGLFAEDVNPNTPMPSLVGAMVAVDAFSQALTNPLLSEHVFHAGTFTDWGFAELSKPQSIATLLQRQNGGTLPHGLTQEALTMTRADWRRERAPF